MHACSRLGSSDLAYNIMLCFIMCCCESGQPGDLHVEVVDTRCLQKSMRLLQSSAAALTCPSGALLLDRWNFFSSHAIPLS